MSSMNHEYYLIFQDYELEENVSLKPDKKTSKSGYGSKELQSGRPLFFTNAYPEYIPEGKTERITDIMFGAGSIVVNEKIKNYISEFPTIGLQIYPAVYIDLNNKFHENLWFLNFYEYLDCWDRETSQYEPGIDDDDMPSIKRFSLDESVLNKIPEKSRYLFSIDGLDEDFIFVHKIVANFLFENNISGFRLIPVTEFVYGMQNFTSA